MEKLIELLNEYGKGSFELEIDNDTGELTGGIIDANQDTFEVTSYYITMQIISKKFGFIERLVEQNKIDDSKVGNSDMLSVQYHDLVNDYKYEGLIMILSISENPISDLCSFLKE